MYMICFHRISTVYFITFDCKNMRIHKKIQKL